MAMNEEVKAELLKLGENVSKDSIEAVFAIAEILIEESENKYDDLIITFLPTLKEKLLEVVDKISDEV